MAESPLRNGQVAGRILPVVTLVVMPLPFHGALACHQIRGTPAVMVGAGIAGHTHDDIDSHTEVMMTPPPWFKLFGALSSVAAFQIEPRSFESVVALVLMSWDVCPSESASVKAVCSSALTVRMYMYISLKPTISSTMIGMMMTSSTATLPRSERSNLRSAARNPGCLRDRTVAKAVVIFRSARCSCAGKSAGECRPAGEYLRCPVSSA